MSRKQYYPIILFIFVFLLAVTSKKSQAQNSSDVLRYSQYYPGNDPVTLAMPGSGTASATGSGSFLANPASAALFGSSQTFLGLTTRNVSETTTFLNSDTDNSSNQTGISNAGFIYKAPVSQGSLVLGASYNKTLDFNRAVLAKGYNTTSTITDMFNQSSFYGDAAYNAFAIDSVGNYTESVLRMGPYNGIDQRAEMIEKGQMGEYSAFVATEFQKNFFVGASIGVTSGSYSYSRTFLETDTKNLYDGTNNTYDVNDILNEDTIDDQITGFKARIGAIYKVNPNFNIGVSHLFKSSLSINEDYSTYIETTFDNDDNFNDSFNGKVKYKVTVPSRTVVGAAITDLNGLDLNFSAEYVDYTQARLKNLDTRIEVDENTFIQENFQKAWNYRASASYRINGNISPRIGYAYYQSPRNDIKADRTFLSAGLGIGLQNQMTLQLGVQYAMWKDQLVLYDYFPPSGNKQNVTAYEDIGRLEVMAGISFKF